MANVMGGAVFGPSKSNVGFDFWNPDIAFNSILVQAFLRPKGLIDQFDEMMQMTMICHSRQSTVRVPSSRI